MKQYHAKLSHWVIILLFWGLTSYQSLAQITLDATYPAANLQRLNLPISGEKWYYANDSTQEILFFNADHTLWKPVKYPTEANKVVSLATINKPISQTTFKSDDLLELVWVFTDTATQRERIKVLNERNDSIFALPEGNYDLTINELIGSPTKLLIENRIDYNTYKTTVYGLPNVVFEKTYDNASDMRRQRFGYMGEVFYFKNRKSNLLEIYNLNHERRRQPINIPVVTNELIIQDPVFFADDKTFNTDTLVEFTFTYWHANGYPLTKIVSENGTEILKTNSYSSYVLDRKNGQPDKILLTYNASINTVNTQYHVIGLPYPTTLENNYSMPVQRIMFKNFGAKYINSQWGAISLFNDNHSSWRFINVAPTSGYYNFDIPPIICDSIVNRDSLLEIIWTERSKALPYTYQLNITTEGGNKLATVPNARYFKVSQLDTLPAKLITQTWNGTRYTETKVWRFTPRTAIAPPSVSNTLNVEVSPNPFTSSFTIDCSDTHTPLSIRLYNAVGVLIFSEKMTASNATLYPPNSLPKGTYILDITDGKKQTLKQLIKL